MTSSLLRPEFGAWAQIRRKGVTIQVLELHKEVHEVHLLTDCGSRLECKELLRYVDGQFQVLVKFYTDQASVTDPSEAFFAEWMHRYIADISTATNDEVLSSLAAVCVCGSTTAPDYPVGGARFSLETSEVECHHWDGKRYKSGSENIRSANRAFYVSRAHSAFYQDVPHE